MTKLYLRVRRDTLCSLECTWEGCSAQVSLQATP